MSVSETTTVGTMTETGGVFAEAVGGIATIVLAIVALAGTSPEFLLSIATIVFGAALLIEGTSIGSDYMLAMSATGLEFGTGGLSAVLMAGFAGIILGVLALVGISATVLTACAVIVFGAATLLSSTASAGLQTIKSQLSGDVALAITKSGSSGAQALAGIAATVLGILAVSGAATQTLSLVALLVLGATLLATGNGMNNAFANALRSRLHQA